MNIQTTKRIKLPAFIFAGSLIVLLTCLFFTSPINNIGYALAFFAALYFGLISGGYLLFSIGREQLSKSSRRNIVITSTILVILLMFRSTQSLGWLELITLILVAMGLVFYSSRR